MPGHNKCLLPTSPTQAVTTSAQQHGSSCRKAELRVICQAGGQEPWAEAKACGLGSSEMWPGPRPLCCATPCGASRPAVSDSETRGLQPAGLLCPWDSPGRNTGVGCHALLQGTLIFSTQGSNPGLLHRQADSSPSEPPREPWAGGLTSLHLSLLTGTITMTRPHPRHSWVRPALLSLSARPLARTHRALSKQWLFFLLSFYERTDMREL